MMKSLDKRNTTPVPSDDAAFLLFQVAARIRFTRQASIPIEGPDQVCVRRWLLIEVVHMGDGVEETFGSA